MRNILDRLVQTGYFEILIFGDKAILEESIGDWPICDFLIGFYSTDFPLEKAINYVKLRQPFCLNDLQLQEVLLDRRLVLSVLDRIGVPTPKRLMTWKQDLPILRPEVELKLLEMGLDVRQYSDHDIAASHLDSQTIQVGSETMRKPFVEKPVSGEDHNVFVYYDTASGGGVRKLFRKVGNQSSVLDSSVETIRQDGSFIYEEFISVDNAEDVKVYTIGEAYAHAETRKSPVVDGLVRRNPEGKEIRYVTPLSDEEKRMAEKITTAFGQTICGFDLLRANGKSFVIDVNGWSFVKGNTVYYDKFAKMVTGIFLNAAAQKGLLSPIPRLIPSENQWKLKAFLSVMRHGDRTPKQKVKFSFKSLRFIQLVNGTHEEVILKSSEQIQAVMETVEQSIKLKEEDIVSLESLYRILQAKHHLSGTKVQFKPGFSKESIEKKIVKVQLIVKWGGEYTHAGEHHTGDLAANLRSDLSLINKELLEQVSVYSSSERRVLATADTFLKTLLNVKELPENFVQVDRDMLDDSNAAKVQMDQVKAEWQKILNPDSPENVPFGFVLPEGLSDLGGLVHKIVELLQSMRKLMRQNATVKDLNRFQSNWCCDESPFLFIERWEKLFRDFCDVERERFEPSKISELHDSIKYDLLHNREFLMNVFAAPAPGTDYVRQLYDQAKTLFNIIGPHEYGIGNPEKLDIGVRNTFWLLKHLYQDLLSSRDSEKPSTRFYFTKESKVICLLNVVLLSHLKTKMVTSDIRELDYLTQITFEVYERNRSSLDGTQSPRGREYSLRIGFSPGAHDPNMIDLQLDSFHSLSVAPRKWISDHINLEEALRILNIEALQALVEEENSKMRL